MDRCSSKAGTLESEVPRKQQPQRIHWVGWCRWPICQSALLTKTKNSGCPCSHPTTASSMSLESSSLRYSKEGGSSSNSTSGAKGIEKDEPAPLRWALPELRWLPGSLPHSPLRLSPSQSAWQARAPSIQPGTRRGCGSGCAPSVGAGWPQSRQRCARQRGRAWR